MYLLEGEVAALPLDDAELKQQAYNAMDCSVTAEVSQALDLELARKPNAALVYRFERACQAVAFQMMLRGIAINTEVRSRVQAGLTRDITKTEKEIALLVGKPLNPRSSKQITGYLYGPDGLALQPLKNRDGVISADKETLARVDKKYEIARPLLGLLKRGKDLSELRKFCQRRLGMDNRMHASFNVGATETGRWSSSSSPLDEGGNLQNVTERMRIMFEADPGWVLFYADLEQAESRAVAYLAEDEAYIEAHMSGDVHTTSSRIFWPTFPWTGDLKKDKVLVEAKTPWDPNQSWRDKGKRLQHGLNYWMKADGVSQHAQIPLAEAIKARDNYFGHFTGIPRWHQSVIRQVQETGSMVTALGRERQFLGRAWDHATWREAIANEPQSLVGDILNIGLMRVWRDLDPNEVQCLANCHDAILGQVRIGTERDVLPEVLERMKVAVNIKGRTMVIPADVKTGKNWGRYHPEENPGGLRSWKG